MPYRGWIEASRLCVFLTVCLTARLNAAQPMEADLAPFVLPWNDGAAGPTSLAFLNHMPAGKFGPIQAKADGHFYAGKERVRFLGVNVCFGATLPEKEAAGLIAARMAKFGINAVRFHHADWHTFPAGLIRSGGRSGDLDPQALERLSFFISELKKNGIYANINLLVSRDFRASDGLPAEIDKLDWKLRHTVAMVYAPMIEMQKQYARDLLTHRNPHTTLRFAEDPAVAFIEINNENGLILHWLDGDLDELPGALGGDLSRQWNRWLVAHHENSAGLQRAWKTVSQPLGPELLADLAAPLQRGGWNLEQHAGAAASARLERNDADRPAAMRIDVDKPGREGWHVQFKPSRIEGESRHRLHAHVTASR